MNKNKRTSKETWCPLTGEIGGHNNHNLIMRARELWGVKGYSKENVFYHHIPDRQQIEKARKIYNRWDELQRDTMYLEHLQDYVGWALDPKIQDRGRYLKDIILWFFGLNASGLEVFSILAIYEARVSKNPAWPLELLALTERYTPDATLGKQRRKQIKEWSARGRASRDNDELSEEDWLAIAKEYPLEKGFSFIATQIIKRLKLSESKHQTIRKWLSKNLEK